jgi:uncharacterized phosphosugar-binding protein
MYLSSWFDTVENTLADIRTGQRENIVRAAEAVADSIAAKGGVFVMDTGHLLQHETKIRAGGLMAIMPFSFQLRLEDDTGLREDTRPPEEVARMTAREVALALDVGTIRSGDVMVINSNSGRSVDVIETAIQCRERSITTIGMASVAQMTACAAKHPSGKKLLEVVDIPLDNGGPVGDAALPVQDNENMCPLSGITAAYIFWAIQAAAVGILEERGIQPTIYRSVHVSGQEYIDEQRARFLKRGY